MARRHHSNIVRAQRPKTREQKIRKDEYVIAKISAGAPTMHSTSVVSVTTPAKQTKRKMTPIEKEIRVRYDLDHLTDKLGAFEVISIDEVIVDDDEDDYSWIGTGIYADYLIRKYGN